MLHSSKTVAALLFAAIFALPAGAQTTTTAQRAAPAQPAARAAGRAAALAGVVGAEAPVRPARRRIPGYTADITTGFAGGVGTTTMTNQGSGAAGGGGAGGKGGHDVHFLCRACFWRLRPECRYSPNLWQPLRFRPEKIMGTSSTAGGKGGTTSSGGSFGPQLHVNDNEHQHDGQRNDGQRQYDQERLLEHKYFQSAEILRGLHPDFPMPPRPTVAQVQPDLQRIIAQSTAPNLKNKSSIQVVAEGNTVVLMGQVGGAGERELAANLLRFNLPGPHNDNRLVVMNQP